VRSVLVFPQQGEVLVEEREEFLFGHVGAAATGLGPALGALILGEDPEVQVDVVLGFGLGVFNGRRPLGRCHLRGVGRLDVERQGTPPPLPPARLSWNLLDEPLLGQLAQVIAGRASALPQCPGQAGGVCLPVLLEVAEDAPAQRVGQCPEDRGLVPVGVAGGFGRGDRHDRQYTCKSSLQNSLQKILHSRKLSRNGAAGAPGIRRVRMAQHGTAQHGTERGGQAGRPPGAVGCMRSTQTMAVLIESMTRTYGVGLRAITALDNVSLAFPAGSFTAVMGPSGSGKSTLLQCAAGLDRPDSGKVSIGGTELSGLGETVLTRLRRDRVGFVFQSFNLMPSLTAAQNVELPLRLAGRKADQKAIRAALATVGLVDRARHRPSELSGGEQQRVAIARALVTSPQVLFADEPTGALDTSTSRDVLQLLSGLVTERRQTVIVVTHDPMAAAYAGRVIFLADGRIADTLERPTAEAIAAHMTRLEVSSPATAAILGGTNSGSLAC
jgi:putative ABC transport system ATP-binding protein